MNHFIRSQKGLTLIEVLVAIVLLGVIVVSFIPLFIQSTRINTQSKDMINATYVAQTLLEDIHFISRESDDDFKIKLISMGYEEVVNNCPTNFCFQQENNGYYIWTEFTNLNSQESLPHAIIKVYEDHSKEQLEAQMETILPLKN